MNKKLVQVGMDDIDSPRSRCTTHLASLLVERLEKEVEWTDYPNLIRLNPSIPYRTRGNGAIALRFLTDNTETILPLVEELVSEYIQEDYPNTNPGVVIIEDSVPKQVEELSKLALWRIVPIKLAKRIISTNDISHYAGGNGRGLIGALAAVGNTLQGDHTYEYIAYRSIGDCNGSRGVDADSVEAMDKAMGNRVFSNIDESTKRILIEPHGPDPVLFGVRGESPQDVLMAGRMVKSSQSVDRWLVFRSNQGTGEHLKYRVRLSNIRPYMMAVFSGKVDSRPRMVEGGHTIFSIVDSGVTVDCAVYEPSGEFRETVMKLIPDDVINVHAGVRPASRKHGLTLNVEGLEVVELAPAFKVSNPLCPRCGKRLKSAGLDKGFKCTKCGHKVAELKKIETEIERDLHKGLYLPPTRAQRHLTKPHPRIAKRKNLPPSSLISKWYSHSK